MLTLMPTAAEAVREILDHSSLGDEAGMRISVSEPGEAPVALQVDFVEQPEDEDRTIEDEGARVFLDPAAADLLDDKALDAQVDERGVSFAVVDARPSPFSDNGRPSD